MFAAVEPAHIDDELELLARLKSGDESAFDRIYERYRNRLYGFLILMSGRRDVAEDLLQETWLRFAGHAASLRTDTRLGPWLFTVARNLFYSYCRNRMLDENRIHEMSCLHRGAIDAQTPLAITAAHEISRRLESALATLRPAYREVLLLVAVEGMAPAEAAAICGLKPEALRKRLSRAREMLAEILEQPKGADGNRKKQP
ncbi:MAG TPA: RNA polymerase sigma factor [Acidobacteriota bacterium]|nr:RNA polymerase sigma factor [Acidobacteriota bacterium]